jgi:hypothetical protein
LYDNFEQKIATNATITRADINEMNDALTVAGIDLPDPATPQTTQAPITADSTEVSSVLDSLEDVVATYNRTAHDAVKNDAFDAMRDSFDAAHDLVEQGQPVQQSLLDSLIARYTNFLHPSTTTTTTTAPPVTVPANEALSLRSYYQNWLTRFTRLDTAQNNAEVQQFRTLFNSNYPSEGAHNGSYLQTDFARMNGLIQNIDGFYRTTTTTTTAAPRTINAQNPVVATALQEIDTFVTEELARIGDGARSAALTNLVTLHDAMQQRLHPAGNGTAVVVTEEQYNQYVDAFDAVINPRQTQAGGDHQGGKYNDGEKAGISLGAIAAAALAVVGIVFGYKKCKNRNAVHPADDGLPAAAPRQQGGFLNGLRRLVGLGGRPDRDADH